MPLRSTPRLWRARHNFPYPFQSTLGSSNLDGWIERTTLSENERERERTSTYRVNSSFDEKVISSGVCVSSFFPLYSSLFLPFSVSVRAVLRLESNCARTRKTCSSLIQPKVWSGLRVDTGRFWALFSTPLRGFLGFMGFLSDRPWVLWQWATVWAQMVQFIHLYLGLGFQQTWGEGGESLIVNNDHGWTYMYRSLNLTSYWGQKVHVGFGFVLWHLADPPGFIAILILFLVWYMVIILGVTLGQWKSSLCWDGAKLIVSFGS